MFTLLDLLGQIEELYLETMKESRGKKNYNDSNDIIDNNQIKTQT